MLISLIVAFDQNKVIGVNGGIPFHLSNDMKRLRRITTNKTIVMGQKTFESIGKALPNRKNVVLSDSEHFGAEGIYVARSIENVLKLCENDDEVIIFGGQTVYKQFEKYVTKMYITEVFHSFEGDTFFENEINYDEWEMTEYEEGIVDEKNKYPHAFYTLIKKENVE